MIAAHYCALPTAITGLRAILVDPALSDAGRIAATLALDPRAADWISHALAHGAHPDVPGRFYATPGKRTQSRIVRRRRPGHEQHPGDATRPRQDVEVVAATLNAHPASRALVRSSEPGTRWRVSETPPRGRAGARPGTPSARPRSRGAASRISLRSLARHPTQGRVSLPYDCITMTGDCAERVSP